MANATKTAGAFDIRYVVAGLIGAYGLILVALGIFRSTEINLWSGLGLLAFAAVFALWARLRPLVVAPVDHDADAADGSHPEH